MRLLLKQSMLITCLLLSGCTNKNPLFTSKKIYVLKNYYAVMGDEKTFPCQQYFAGITAPSSLSRDFKKTCDTRLKEEYEDLKHCQSEKMRGISFDDFQDKNVWKRYLGQ